MNKPSDQNPTHGPARSGDQTQPGKGVPPSFDSQPPQDPRETAPDIGKKPDAGRIHQPRPGKDDAKPMQAARGDDEVMSQPQPGKRI